MQAVRTQAARAQPCTHMRTPHTGATSTPDMHPNAAMLVVQMEYKVHGDIYLLNK